MVSWFKADLLNINEPDSASAAPSAYKCPVVWFLLISYFHMERTGIKLDKTYDNADPRQEG